jgi:hypothetical protein
VVTVAIWITATACAPPAVSVAPTPSLSPASDVCQPIDLRTESGERVDLNGTWQTTGGGRTYYAYQEADCVWIVGGFVTPEEDAPFGNIGKETLTFAGHLQDDATVDGRWASIIYARGPGAEGPYSGSLTFSLELGADPWKLRAEGFPTLERVSDMYVAP